MGRKEQTCSGPAVVIKLKAKGEIGNRSVWLPRLEVRNSGGRRSPSFCIDTVVNREPSYPDQVVICPDHRAFWLASSSVSFEPLRCSSRTVQDCCSFAHTDHTTHAVMYFPIERAQPCPHVTRQFLARPYTLLVVR